MGEPQPQAHAGAQVQVMGIDAGGTMTDTTVVAVWTRRELDRSS